jgi:hypothetical protein
MHTHIVNKHDGTVGQPCCLQLIIHDTLKDSSTVDPPKRQPRKAVELAAPPTSQNAVVLQGYVEEPGTAVNFGHEPGPPHLPEQLLW